MKTNAVANQGVNYGSFGDYGSSVDFGNMGSGDLTYNNSFPTIGSMSFGGN